MNIRKMITAGSMCAVLAVSSVTPAAAQFPGFGAVMGGAMGGVIGGRGGPGGAIAGAIIGIAAGAILQGMVDDIERNNAKQAANVALKNGTGGTKTFKNSKGQQVKVTSKARTYKNAEGKSCREITTSVQRDGQASAGGGTQTQCVQLASNGAANYGTIQ